jgi:hypothetical protein
VTAGQSDFPIDTLEQLLRDHERRILQMERRPAAHWIWVEGLAAVASRSELDDPDIAVYALDEDTVYHRGLPYTLAEWQARARP